MAHGGRRAKRNRANKRDYIQAIKKNPCKDCNNTYESGEMTFDHLPGTIKHFNIGEAVRYSWEEIKLELEKCELVCVFCHIKREKTRQASKVKKNGQTSEYKKRLVRHKQKKSRRKEKRSNLVATLSLFYTQRELLKAVVRIFAVQARLTRLGNPQ